MHCERHNGKHAVSALEVLGDTRSALLDQNNVAFAGLQRSIHDYQIAMLNSIHSHVFAAKAGAGSRGRILDNVPVCESGVEN